MNYASINKCDMMNGNGVRISLFVSGCPHMCEGCFNESTWTKTSGEAFTQDVKRELLENLSENHIAGLSLLGGEPLAPYNLSEVILLCREFKQNYPNKDIWIWSGYTMEQIASDPDRQEILNYVDYLIDGKFEKNLTENVPRFRGSSNQKRYRVLHENDSWQPVLID